MADRSGEGGVASFLLGGVIGAVVALLLAPTSGEETRRRLNDWLEENRKRTRKFLDEEGWEAKKSKLSEALHAKKEQVETVLEAGKKAYEAGKKAYREASHRHETPGADQES